MPAVDQFLVLESVSFTSFTRFMLQPRLSPSTLIVCSTRDQFLQDLLPECRQASKAPSSPSEEPQTRPRVTHPLLIPTIHLLATSRNVNVAFTPTLLHLRAYLTVYEAPNVSEDDMIAYDKPTRRAPVLGILNILQLHQETTDFSAQGLSRTLSLVVEAAARNNMQLTVGDISTHEDTEMEDTEIQGQPLERNPWRQQVPLLSGSVRFGSEQRVWAGRTVEARQVAGRWFQFVSIEQINEEG